MPSPVLFQVPRGSVLHLDVDGQVVDYGLRSACGLADVNTWEYSNALLVREVSQLPATDDIKYCKSCFKSEAKFDEVVGKLPDFSDPLDLLTAMYKASDMEHFREQHDDAINRVLRASGKLPDQRREITVKFRAGLSYDALDDVEDTVREITYAIEEVLENACILDHDIDRPAARNLTIEINEVPA